MSRKTRERRRAAQRRHRELLRAAYAKTAVFQEPGLRKTAIALMRADPQASDYLAQAPVLVYAFAQRHRWLVGGPYSSVLTNEFRAMLGRSRRLRDVMAELGLPWPMRKLDASVMQTRHIPAIDLMARTPPAVLGGVLGRGIRHQKHLMLVLDGSTDFPVRISHLPAGFSGWLIGSVSDRIAVPALLGGFLDARAEVTTVLDYLTRLAAPIFDPRQSWLQALAAARRWHERLAAEREELDARASAAVADYGTLPLTLSIDGFEFIALRTRSDLFQEGKALAHCVASYWPAVIAGVSCIYGIRRCGERVATMEVRQSFRRTSDGSQSLLDLVQVQGQRNLRPADATLVAAVKAFGEMQPLSTTDRIALMQRFQLHREWDDEPLRHLEVRFGRDMGFYRRHLGLLDPDPNGAGIERPHVLHEIEPRRIAFPPRPR